MAARLSNRQLYVNGLNQYTQVGAENFCHDANGNLTADGQYVYLYDYENRLVQMRNQVNTNCASLSYTGAGTVDFWYDPLGRLYKIDPGASRQRFVHDGDALIAEYDATSGNMLRRYVHGPDLGSDDPLIWFEGAGYDWPDVRYLYADPRGSIVLVAGEAGNRIAINAYDEYGIPDLDNGVFDIPANGRFRYTGQLWIPELGMYYYKARIYSPRLGRFMQTDPIGYEDQFNLYAYVANDPIDGIDPTGTSCKTSSSGFGSKLKARVNCKVDDRDSFRDAGYSDEQIDSFERDYTRAVRKLDRNPERTVKIGLGDETLEVKAFDVSLGLKYSYVKFEEGTGQARMAGGELSRTQGGGVFEREYRPLSSDTYFTLGVGRNFIRRWDGEAISAFSNRRQLTFTHEGLHTVPGEGRFRGVPNFQTRHQDKYKQAAQRLLEP